VGQEQRIVINHRARWGSVPESLIEDQRLSADARLAAIWLTVKPDGWQILIGVMIHRLGMTTGRWQAARRELIAAGYLRSIRRQYPSGQIYWDQRFDPVPGGSDEPDQHQQPTHRTTDHDIPAEIRREMEAAARAAKNPAAYQAALEKKYRLGGYLRASPQREDEGAQRRLADLRAQRRLVDSRVRADQGLGLTPRPADLAALAALDEEIAGLVAHGSADTPDAPPGAPGVDYATAQNSGKTPL
jgi:hypothetical protein